MTLVCVNNSFVFHLSGEQLAHTKRTSIDDDETLANILGDYSGARFICETTKLTQVPKNIFWTPSAE